MDCSSECKKKKSNGFGTIRKQFVFDRIEIRGSERASVEERDRLRGYVRTHVHVSLSRYNAFCNGQCITHAEKAVVLNGRTDAERSNSSVKPDMRYVHM